MAGGRNKRNMKINNVGNIFPYYQINCIGFRLPESSGERVREKNKHREVLQLRKKSFFLDLKLEL